MGSSINSSSSQPPYAPKILYSPDTPLTRSIIHRANRTFASVELILSWTTQINNCSTFFLDKYPRDSSDIASLRNGTAALLASPTPLTEKSREQLTEVNKLLDPDNPKNLWVLLERAKAASASTKHLLSQFDWDVFKPVASEEEMERRARTTLPVLTRGNDTVFGGVAFQGNMSSIERPKVVSFSLRLNTTFVHDTSEVTST